MWSELLPILNPDGKDTGVDLLLLDCEGLGSKSRSFDLDVKVFALTVLLSSNLVFNQLGHITDQALESFSVLQMLQSQIKYRPKGQS